MIDDVEAGARAREGSRGAPRESVGARRRTVPKSSEKSRWSWMVGSKETQPASSDFVHSTRHDSPDDGFRERSRAFQGRSETDQASRRAKGQRGSARVGHGAATR